MHPARVGWKTFTLSLFFWENPYVANLIKRTTGGEPHLCGLGSRKADNLYGSIERRVFLCDCIEGA